MWKTGKIFCCSVNDGNKAPAQAEVGPRGPSKDPSEYVKSWIQPCCRGTWHRTFPSHKEWMGQLERATHMSLYPK